MKTRIASLLLVLLTLCAGPARAASLTGTTCPGAACEITRVTGAGGVAIQVTGTFVGTLQFEQTIDGTNWVSLSVTPVGSTIGVTSATATGFWSGSVGGADQVRVRFSSYMSGAAVVNIGQSQARAGHEGGVRITLAGVPLINAVIKEIHGGPLDTGDHDLYTVPTSKSAYMGEITLNDASGVGNIVVFEEIKISATYHRVSSNHTTTNGGSLAFAPNVFMQAGDVLAINSATNNGLYFTATIIEFDAATPLKLGRMFATLTGDNTIYTCPTGKVAVPVSPSNASVVVGVAGVGVFVSDSGTTRSIGFNLVRSGGSVAASNSIADSASSSANVRTNVSIAGTLAAGDFISARVDVGAAGQASWVVMFEQDL